MMGGNTEDEANERRAREKLIARRNSARAASFSATQTAQQTDGGSSKGLEKRIGSTTENKKSVVGDTQDEKGNKKKSSVTTDKKAQDKEGPDSSASTATRKSSGSNKQRSERQRRARARERERKGNQRMSNRGGGGGDMSANVAPGGPRERERGPPPSRGGGGRYPPSHYRDEFGRVGGPPQPHWDGYDYPPPSGGPGHYNDRRRPPPMRHRGRGGGLPPSHYRDGRGIPPGRWERDRGFPNGNDDLPPHPKGLRRGGRSRSPPPHYSSRDRRQNLHRDDRYHRNQQHRHEDDRHPHNRHRSRRGRSHDSVSSRSYGSRSRTRSRSRSFSSRGSSSSYSSEEDSRGSRGRGYRSHDSRSRSPSRSRSRSYSRSRSRSCSRSRSPSTHSTAENKIEKEREEKKEELIKDEQKPKGDSANLYNNKPAKKIKDETKIEDGDGNGSQSSSKYSSSSQKANKRLAKRSRSRSRSRSRGRSESQDSRGRSYRRERERKRKSTRKNDRSFDSRSSRSLSRSHSPASSRSHSSASPSYSNSSSHHSRERRRERRAKRRRKRQHRGSSSRGDKHTENEFSKDQRTIFVSQLVMRTTERDLKKYFKKKVGCKVNDVILLRDRRNARNHKGCAYVEVGRIEDIAKALGVSGQPPDFQRFPILIKASEAEKNYVKPMAAELSAANVTINANGITDSLLGTSATNGYANTSSSDQKQRAGQFNGAGKPLPPLRDENGRLIESQKIYVGGLDPSVGEEHLYALFSQFGTLQNVQLQYHPNTQTSRGYAFLAFRDPKVSHLAIRSMAGQFLAGRPIKTGWANQNQQSSASISSGFAVVTSDQFPENAAELTQKALTVQAQMTGGSVALADQVLANSVIGASNSNSIGSSATATASMAEQELDKAMGLVGAGTATSTSTNGIPTVAEARASLAAGGAGPLHAMGATVAEARASMAADVAARQLAAATSAAAVAAATESRAAAVTKLNFIGNADNGPTLHLLVHNMYDKDEETEDGWEIDIKEEFLEECSKFGKIEHAKVMHNEEGGKIYATFSDLKGAKTCAENLAGRWFDKRQLRVDYMSVANPP